MSSGWSASLKKALQHSTMGIGLAVAAQSAIGAGIVGDWQFFAGLGIFVIGFFAFGRLWAAVSARQDKRGIRANSAAPESLSEVFLPRLIEEDPVYVRFAFWTGAVRTSGFYVTGLLAATGGRIP